MSSQRSSRRPSVPVAAALSVAAAIALPACAAQPGPPPFEIVWGGDILLGDAAAPLLEAHGFAWPFERIASLLDADYLVGNAEGPITDLDEPYFPDQRFSYNADPASAAALAEVGFDAVSLSNNHAMDRGPDGLLDTIDHLTDAGVAVFGAGTDADALAPHLVETPHGSLAIVGLGDRWSYGAEATAEALGTASITKETVSRAYELAADAGARWTVAFVHWGVNYDGVTDEQRAAAALFADAGYDLVIGHHPHVAQEVDVVDGMPVLYSLGNLAFGTPGRFDAGQGYGLVARTALRSDGTIEIRLTCIVTDNEQVEYQPEPCVSAEADGLLGRLGPHVRVEDGVGIVDASD